jgi:hypothetical protein
MNLDINVVLLYFIQMLSLIRNFIMRGNGIITIKPVSQVTPVALGRWGIQYDQKIIDCKVFQANEDHCGCCVDVKIKTSLNEAVEKGIRYEKTEEYLLPYVV